MYVYVVLSVTSVCVFCFNESRTEWGPTSKLPTEYWNNGSEWRSGFLGCKVHLRSQMRVSY